MSMMLKWFKVQTTVHGTWNSLNLCIVGPSVCVGELMWERRLFLIQCTHASFPWWMCSAGFTWKRCEFYQKLIWISASRQPGSIQCCQQWKHSNPNCASLGHYKRCSAGTCRFDSRRVAHLCRAFLSNVICREKVRTKVSPESRRIYSFAGGGYLVSTDSDESETLFVFVIVTGYSSPYYCPPLSWQ